MLHEGFRVPDKVFWWLAILVNILTWGLIGYFYSSLPTRVPTHFGPAGLPDAYAQKTFWTVFLPALTQSGIILLISWVYRHPQYSNIPSSLPLMAVPEPWKTRITMIMRHMLVMVTVLVNLLFAYVALGVLTTAFGLKNGLNNLVIGGLLTFLLFLISVYAVWLYRLSKQAAIDQQKK